MLASWKKSESEIVKVLVPLLCPTVCDPMDCSSPGSSVHGILQARTLGVGCHFFLQCIKVKSESESEEGDYNQGIKGLLLLGRKAISNLDSILKSRDITLSTNV